MAICEIHLNQNNVLQKMVSLTAILPEGKKGPFPVFYLLHGLSDDHTAWTRRSNIERYVDGLPLIVIMPNGERSFYSDAVNNPRAAFETFMTHDLIQFVDSTFQTIPTREGRVIAGLSMGGYGAFKLALKHPDLFQAAVSHSGAVAFAHRDFSGSEEWHREWAAVLGPSPKGGPEDIFTLLESGDPGTRPALRFDCGVDDFLIQENRNLQAQLEELSIPYEYEEHPGGHTWQYWNEHVLDTLKFFSPLLGLPEFKPEDHR